MSMGHGSRLEPLKLSVLCKTLAHDGGRGGAEVGDRSGSAERSWDEARAGGRGEVLGPARLRATRHKCVVVPSALVESGKGTAWLSDRRLLEQLVRENRAPFGSHPVLHVICVLVQCRITDSLMPR